MTPKRGVLWLLTAIASVFPAWWVFSSIVRIDPPFSDFVLSVFIIIVPIVAMGTMAIWALRVGAPPEAASETRFKTIALVVLLGHVGAFIVINRSMRIKVTSPNADTSA